MLSGMKAKTANEVRKFEDIPNIGPAMVRDFTALGLKTPRDLKKQDAYKLYKKLCKIMHTRMDPCVLDTYIAAIDFLNGAPARPWFAYTKERKKKFPDV